MNKPLILIDGSSYLFRAFHALPPLTNSHGEPTNVILGVMNMLNRLLNDYDPEHIVVVFDTKGKNFRHELYPEYKANRDGMPEDLGVQIEPLQEMIQLMGLPVVALPGIEADDVIGTLTHQANQHGKKVLISTGDKDMAQLIHDNVTIIDTMKNVVMDADYVQEKFGVRPDQIIDFLALVGDTADNIPGVPKVGPKTAAKWLGQYDTVENIKTHAEDITGKVGEYLRENFEQLDLSKKLTTINCHIDIQMPLADMARKPMDIESLMPKLKHYELKSWVKRLEEYIGKDHCLGSDDNNNSPELLHHKAPHNDNEKRADTMARPYTAILTESDWKIWQDKIKAAELIAVDTETTSLDAMQAKLVGVSFATQSGEAAYLPLAHDYPGAPEQLNNQQTFGELKALLENPEIKKIGQHIKYDYKVLANHDINMQGIMFDTMLASYVLEAGLTRHGLDVLAKRHLDYDMTSYEEVVGKGAKQITFDQVEIETATQYAAEDADITYRLYQYFNSELEEKPSLQKLFETEEMPTLSVLATMEQNGVLINANALTAQSQEIEAKLLDLEKRAFELVGEAFNLSSPKQLQEILFEKMGLPIVKKTPKGQPSTNEAVLQELAHNFDLPKVILEHRHLSKLKSTYTDKLPLMINPKTGRVHTSYHQAVASTGRLSSTDPNLQNIPIRSEEGRRIRKAFIASPGHQLIAADYSQIELRIMAHLSGDKGLLDAFSNNEDVHRATAAEVFGVAKANVTNEQRRRAKAINFGLIYGMSAFGLAKQLNIPRDEASLYVKVYFDRYPGVKDYMERKREQAAKQGYVETLFGRCLSLPEINSRNGMRRQAAERAAINAPMQGTAADIIKRAMIDIQNWLQNNQFNIKMIMQVHDELIFEVADDQIEKATAQIKALMENAAQLEVPLIVDVGVGHNWEEAH